MNVYIHTLDGRPAYFDRNEKLIFFAPHTKKIGEMIETDLRSIKHQKSISDATCVRMGYPRTEIKAGYFLIRNIEDILPHAFIADEIIKFLGQFDPREIDRGVINNPAFKQMMIEHLKGGVSG